MVVTIKVETTDKDITPEMAKMKVSAWVSRDLPKDLELKSITVRTLKQLKRR